MTTKSPLLDRTLEKAFEKAGGDHKKVAAVAGVSGEAARKWKEGTNKPRGTHLEKLMAFVGEVPATPHSGAAVSGGATGEGEALKVFGVVSAGLTRVAEQEERVISSPSRVWKTSVYRKLTMNEVIYLEVKGNSMEPDYPDGCFLACAKPAVRMDEIPDLTPVIARVNDDATFKLFRVSYDRNGRKEVELLPINRSFHIQRFNWRDAVVDYIALGFINPWKHGLNSEPRSLVLRERG
jgi:SOS-response transcriptional repressor LexA